MRRLAPAGEVSAFLATAVSTYLRWTNGRDAFERGFGAWSDEAHPELATSEDTFHYVRSLRSEDEGATRRIADSGGK